MQATGFCFESSPNFHTIEWTRGLWLTREDFEREERIVKPWTCRGRLSTSKRQCQFGWRLSPPIPGSPRLATMVQQPGSAKWATSPGQCSSSGPVVLRRHRNTTSSMCDQEHYREGNWWSCSPARILKSSRSPGPRSTESETVHTPKSRKVLHVDKARMFKSLETPLSFGERRMKVTRRREKRSTRLIKHRYILLKLLPNILSISCAFHTASNRTTLPALNLSSHQPIHAAHNPSVRHLLSSSPYHSWCRISLHPQEEQE